MGQSIAWAIEDRMDSSKQLNLLLNSQGDSYKPFLSETINSAVKNKQMTSKGLLDVVRTISSGGTVNIFNQNNQATLGGDTFTIAEAAKVIESNSSSLLAGSQVTKAIEANYDKTQWPEVVASKQESLAMNVSKEELKQITGDYSGSKSAHKKEHHELRRQIAQNIDYEEMDPEILIE
jgi:hypothetical protein